MVVPLYNVEDYLVSCLESIADQTFSDLEVVLVDDGSPDTSGDIAEEFAAGRDGPGTYSASRPGRYGVDYYYEDLAGLQQIARTGATVVRVAVTWERLQHQLKAPLDEREVRRVNALLSAAQEAGLGVILCVGETEAEREAGSTEERLTTQLTAALRDLEAADKAKDRFIAVLSHELRNPLASVASAVEVLAEGGTGTDLRERALDIVRRQTATMRQLLEDLLDVTRIIRGKMPYQWEVADAHALAGRTLDICGCEAQAKRIELASDLSAPEYHVRADPARLPS